MPSPPRVRAADVDYYPISVRYRSGPRLAVAQGCTRRHIRSNTGGSSSTTLKGRSIVASRLHHVMLDREAVIVGFRSRLAAHSRVWHRPGPCRARAGVLRSEAFSLPSGRGGTPLQISLPALIRIVEQIYYLPRSGRAGYEPPSHSLPEISPAYERLQRDSPRPASRSFRTVAMARRRGPSRRPRAPRRRSPFAMCIRLAGTAARW